MSFSDVGTAEPAVPTTDTTDRVERALEFCDQALDLMLEEQREGTVSPRFQDIVCAVEATRTELTCMKSA